MALEESEKQHMQLVVSYQTQHEVKTLLQKFEQAMGLYKQTFDNQVSSNKDFQQVFRNARLYVSHFIQVLNLSVQRNEIKREHKKLYHLDPDDFSVPEMVTAEAVLEWGKNIIEGEAQRMKTGGVPLYNPAIAKVQVHYDIFKEFRDNQVFLQQNTARYAEHVNKLRQPVDELLVEVWNQIEGFFNQLPPFKRMESCKQFGVIYYYRKGETELTPADDLPKPVEVEVVAEQPTEEVIALAPIVEQLAEEVEAFEPMAVMEESITESIEQMIEVETVSTVEEIAVEPLAEKSTPVPLNEMFVEETLFAVQPEESATEIRDEIPEMKLDSIIPKKRKKRAAKQDALLSLFFQ
jgi:hypothetical protein